MLVPIIDQTSIIGPLVSQTPPDDRLGQLMTDLRPFFSSNVGIAVILCFAFASGGTANCFSIELTGPSSSGKSTIVSKIRELFDHKIVLQTSEISKAGLFVTETPDIVIEDEFIRAPWYNKFRRNCISNGMASRHLSTPSGQLRIQQIKGNLSFISCQTTHECSNIQDSNRSLKLLMSDSPDQMWQHAIRAAVCSGIFQPFI